MVVEQLYSSQLLKPEPYISNVVIQRITIEKLLWLSWKVGKIKGNLTDPKKFSQKAFIDFIGLYNLGCSFETIERGPFETFENSNERISRNLARFVSSEMGGVRFNKFSIHLYVIFAQKT